jgi:hypothetical protein
MLNSPCACGRQRSVTHLAPQVPLTSRSLRTGEQRSLQQEAAENLQLCGALQARHIPDAVLLSTCAVALIVRDLHQVLVWVANIDGAHFSHCAGAFDRAFFNVNFLFVQVPNHFVERN